ncbi:MAG TPA: thiamine phosphate synthase [Methylomirabilota bacterium]|nr:thiamine phosphate synthase [Methylomirabilota bacterium]
MKLPLPRLHAITDERIARRGDLDEVARELAAGGGPGLAFHARGRALTGLEHSELANRLSVYPPTRLFVNDRLDIAMTLNAAGVQLGTGSLPVSAARRLNSAWWIGKSVHHLAEADAAKAEGADYLLVGPVYATATHPDRAPLGLETLARICRLGLPVIAIGGIGPGRAREVKAAGAYGAAAIRALWDAADPADTSRRMVEELQ